MQVGDCELGGMMFVGAVGACGTSRSVTTGTSLNVRRGSSTISPLLSLLGTAAANLGRLS